MSLTRRTYEYRCECGRTLTIAIDVSANVHNSPQGSGEGRPTLQHPDDPISDNQKRAIYAIAKKFNIPIPEYNQWTKGVASEWIEKHGQSQKNGYVNPKVNG